MQVANEDFEYWKQYYLEYSETKIFKKRVEFSLNVIQDFIDLGTIKATINCSGGKDSVAMAHLVNNTHSARNYVVVSEKDDIDYPGEEQYMKDLALKYFWLLDIIRPSELIFDKLKNFNFCEDIHSSNTSFGNDYFYALLKEYQERNNIKALFIGLRAEESKARAMNVKTKGLIYYKNSDGLIVIQPLAYWEAKDVFAYLLSNDIPIFEIYTKLKYIGCPELIRKSWILPGARACEGNAQWLNYYYPDLFHKLSEIDPNIRSYV